MASEIMFADVDAEVRLLAILLRKPEKLDEIYMDIKADMFTDPVYRTIYETMQSLYVVRGKCNQMDLTRGLIKQKSIGDVSNTLAEISKYFISERELPSAVEIIKSAATRRQIGEGLAKLQNIVATERNMAIVGEAVSRETTGWMAKSEKHQGTSQEVLADIYPEYLAAKDGKPIHSGPTTGLIALDSITQELENGAMMVLAGRTHMGKSAVALNLACGIAQRHGWVLFHLLEMTRKQAMRRLIQAKARVSQLELKSATEEAQGRIEQAFNELSELPIVWNDQRGMSAPELCAMARHAKREHDIKAWFVDYLQLIPTTGEKGRSTSLQFGDIVRTLRDCAGELGIPIILLSQLNRSVEARREKEPMMSDLRESGNIEEFADYITFVHRPGYYEPDKDQAELQLIVDKNRVTGGRGKAYCTLIEQHQYIVSRTQQHRQWEYLNDTPEGRKSWW